MTNYETFPTIHSVKMSEFNNKSLGVVFHTWQPRTIRGQRGQMCVGILVPYAND